VSDKLEMVLYDMEAFRAAKDDFEYATSVTNGDMPSLELQAKDILPVQVSRNPIRNYIRSVKERRHNQTLYWRQFGEEMMNDLEQQTAELDEALLETVGYTPNIKRLTISQQVKANDQLIKNGHKGPLPVYDSAGKPIRYYGHVTRHDHKALVFAMREELRGKFYNATCTEVVKRQMYSYLFNMKQRLKEDYGNIRNCDFNNSSRAAIELYFINTPMEQSLANFHKTPQFINNSWNARDSANPIEYFVHSLSPRWWNKWYNKSTNGNSGHLH